METIENKSFSQERALYLLNDADVTNCVFFDPENIGESPLKESKNIYISSCKFCLRYPLWHMCDSSLEKSEFTDTSRAALWYNKNLIIEDCKLNGTKALRECKNIVLKNSEASSLEFGWRCNKLSIDNFKLVSEYPFFFSKKLFITNLEMKGKYSFQYVKNAKLFDCKLDTKDAFWHTNHVTVVNCEIKGEYIGWYSKNLTLINCKISGTQPFCYCKNLRLINCELTDADLAFEYSSVKADLNGKLISVKNPSKGYIKVDKIDEIILSNSKYKNKCKLITK